MKKTRDELDSDSDSDELVIFLIYFNIFLPLQNLTF